MTDEKPKFYRVDDVPETVRRRFDAAVEKVRRGADLAGEPHVSLATAFVGLITGTPDLDAAIDAGKKAARDFATEEREPRHYHLPPEVKREIDVAAGRNGINIGALGRLLMTACAAGEDEQAAVAVLAETILRGIAARRNGGEVEGDPVDD